METDWRESGPRLCGLSCFAVYCHSASSNMSTGLNHCLCVRLCVCVCVSSFLCRVVAIDADHRVAIFSLGADTEIQLTSDRASFFLVRTPSTLTCAALSCVVCLNESNRWFWFLKQVCWYCNYPNSFSPLVHFWVMIQPLLWLINQVLPH